MFRFGRLGRLIVLVQSAVVILGAVKAARAALRSPDAEKQKPEVKRLPAPRHTA